MELPILNAREYAPTDREELMEMIGSLACDGECSYHVPRQDRHHHIFNTQGELTPAEQLLRSHPDFITRMCRCAHECLHKRWDRSEPISTDFVIGYLLASPVNMSKTRKKKLNKLRGGR